MNWTLSVEKKRCGLFKRILLLKSFENPVKLNPWPRWQRQRVNLNIGNFIKFRRNDVNNLKRIYIYIYIEKEQKRLFLTIRNFPSSRPRIISDRSFSRLRFSITLFFFFLNFLFISFLYCIDTKRKKLLRLKLRILKKKKRKKATLPLIYTWKAIDRRLSMRKSGKV